ncbi:peptidoglycan-binding protein [Streptomyces sp. NPDC056549]|uniref:peptidoglycan-binding domain-containing protein n=1 Tax=unclassified Streptomyces TaxID=2593676 RepID=UPI003687E0B2
MPNRTALTTAVTSGSPEQTLHPAPDDHIFGRVARPDEGGQGARVQDVEMFDVTPATPPAGQPLPRRRHGAGKPRYTRKAPQARKATEPRAYENRGGLSLPLLITGALAAGIGLTVGLTSPSDQAIPDGLTLTMPDLPAPDPTPDAGPSSAGPSATPAGKASPTPRTASPTPTATATTPRTQPPTTAPPSSPAPPADPTPSTTRPPAPTPTPTSTSGSRRPGRSDSHLLKLGSSGPDVVDLQLRLQQLYLYLGSADGVFSGSVEAALTRFQKARDIPEEAGVYGPLTRAALYAETHRPDRRNRHDRNPWAGPDFWDL